MLGTYAILNHGRDEGATEQPSYPKPNPTDIVSAPLDSRIENKTSFLKTIETSILIDFYPRADIWELMHWLMEG
jgi:hypothetical protein